uniref:Mitochondrial import inner membrane translocase subunit n=1 Tax=Glossina palpalis gambiensis TaxID=67801 RepID=A0A1B0B0X8_9MUSC
MSDLMTSTNSEKEEIIEEVKQQLAAANAQELLTKMTEKCFCKCITRPGAQLNSSEQKCISMCMDRFIDSWNLVSRAYGTRIQREQNRINICKALCRENGFMGDEDGLVRGNRIS